MCVLLVARFVFTTCSSPTVDIHTLATPPKRLSLPSLPIGKLCTLLVLLLVLERILQNKNYVAYIDRTQHMVALNYTLNKHMKYVRQMV